MLEKFQKMLEEYKTQKESELITPDIETVQEYFKMQDTNKWLKLKATNMEQVRRADRYEANLQNLLKKLYVPVIPTQNI